MILKKKHKNETGRIRFEYLIINAYNKATVRTEQEACINGTEHEILEQMHSVFPEDFG